MKYRLRNNYPTDPEKALKAIRIVFGVGPSIAFIISILPALKSKISRERINAVKVELENRKNSQEDTLDEFHVSDEYHITDE